ncbi:hypothetical protein [Bordetella petrii]|uniref:hypothetical protein n=1 Tax=Bordetella petrii TaxID=94624 RepID=UPI00047D6ECE|nr:hypothetical protein [Bordetella petrii]
MTYLLENINSTIAKVLECMARDPKRAERLLGDVKRWVGELAAGQASAEPVAAQKGDDARDAERWRWITDDHNDPRVRVELRALFDRLPVMSYSAACAAVDAAIAQQRQGEGGQ